MTGAEWLDSVTLYPFTFSYAPPVLWTLSFELGFYTLFLCAFFNRKLFLILLAAWGVVGYSLCILGYAEGTPALLGSGYTFLFGVGVLAFFVVRRLPPLSGAALAAMSIISLMVFGVAAYLDIQLQMNEQYASLARSQRLLTPLFGIAGFFAVIVLSQPRMKLSGWLHRFLFFLGSASYSIYLWHLLPQRLIAHFAGRFGLVGVDQRWIVEALIFTSGIAIGSAAFLFVEKPLIKRIKRMLRGGALGRPQDAMPAIDPGRGGGH